MANNTSNVDAQCRATIEASYPLFVIHTNHVTTLPDVPLRTLCQQIFATALQNLALTPSLASASSPPLLSLDAILTATFDPAHRAFFVLPPADADAAATTTTTTTSRLDATLSADAHATVFAQAIAGIVAVLRAVATTTSCCRRRSFSPAPLLTADEVEVVRATLRRFAEGEERVRVLQAVEAWAGWGDCFEKAQIGGMIMRVLGIDVAAAAAVRAGEAAVMGEERKVGGEVSVVEVDEALFNDGPHPQRQLGVPDKFTIMALN